MGRLPTGSIQKKSSISHQNSTDNCLISVNLLVFRQPAFLSNYKFWTCILSYVPPPCRWHPLVVHPPVDDTIFVIYSHFASKTRACHWHPLVDDAFQWFSIPLSMAHLPCQQQGGGEVCTIYQHFLYPFSLPLQVWVQLRGLDVKGYRRAAEHPLNPFFLASLQIKFIIVQHHRQAPTALMAANEVPRTLCRWCLTIG